ncbi:MAG: ATP-binding cassette domain-containing protein [Aquificae bacterium]|nr:ATP-binding cassette domain-containing protein [Aquificota bacterium]
MRVIEVHNLKKFYKKKEVLKGISFHVEKGEILGFVGPNGAGKSTTLKIIMNFIRPSEGKVRIFGEENDKAPYNKVGFLPEHPYFYLNVTGREFLKFVSSLVEINSKNFWNNVELYGEKLEISWALDKKLSEYSKGMLQRFGLLQAIVYNPELIILDEPMSGLDPIGRRLVMDLMLELKDKGKTIFFSTHILPDIERVCDRAILIVNGKITDEVEKKDLPHVEELLLDRVRAEGIVEVR